MIFFVSRGGDERGISAGINSLCTMDGLNYIHAVWIECWDRTYVTWKIQFLCVTHL